jgi:cellulose synthase/poly-beta-1,6-N-acetylglucosamine synthase-like glycosyltransferase
MAYPETIQYGIRTMLSNYWSFLQNSTAIPILDTSTTDLLSISNGLFAICSTSWKIVAYTSWLLVWLSLNVVQFAAVIVIRGASFPVSLVRNVVSINVHTFLAAFATTSTTHSFVRSFLLAALCLIFIAISYHKKFPFKGVTAVFAILHWEPVYSIALVALGAFTPLRGFLEERVHFYCQNPWYAAFSALFAFKFVKIVVHFIAYNFFDASAETPEVRTVSSADVTVVIPSISSFDDGFVRCIKSVLANDPAKIIISTAGADNLIAARRFIDEFSQQNQLPNGLIKAVATNSCSKRHQFIMGAVQAKTNIIAFCDDSSRWPSTFLNSILAEFEDPLVGLVGSVKRVIRDRGTTLSQSFRNYLACIYLERHNFECTATYNIDGGVFVISGRTGLIRTSIVQNKKFQDSFLSETFMGRGPMNVDDDNFVTRYTVNHGWKTVFHNRPEACIESALGVQGGWGKFAGQLLRWARTTWRSNLRSMLIDCVCWERHPWTSYAMFVSLLFNISILYEPMLFLCLYNSGFATRDVYLGLLCLLIISKLLKPWSYLRRNPEDVCWVVPGMLFGYAHGLLRLYALVTMTDISWSGRKGVS